MYHRFVKITGNVPVRDSEYFGVELEDGLLAVYNAGFPEISGTGFAIKTQEISPAQFMDHYRNRVEEMGKKLESRDLVAACWAARREFLKGVVDNVGKGFRGKSIHPAPPMSGFYVVGPATEDSTDRCGAVNLSIDPLVGLERQPALHPRQIAEMLAIEFPEGFFSIRAGVYEDTAGIEAGRQEHFRVPYFVHAIPEDAKDWVRFSPNNREGKGNMLSTVETYLPRDGK